MPANKEYEVVFARLKQLLAPYAANLKVIADAPDNFVLDAPLPDHNAKEVMFAAVKIHKSYVSYYLMCVYFFPDLREGLSEELLKRLPGNACFNLKKVDDTLLAELAALTERGYRRFQLAGWVPQTAQDAAGPQAG
jgi:hypothetical protein